YRKGKNDWAASPAAAFCLFPLTTVKRRQTVCLLRNLFQPYGKQNYHRPGDLTIGGNLPLGTLMYSSIPHFWKEPFQLSLSILMQGFLSKTLLGVGFEIPQEYRPVYPSFFRINPSDFPECVGLVQLLLYFQWNWVGLVTSEDDSGEYFIATLMPMLKEKEICLAFNERISDEFNVIFNKLMYNILLKAEVIIQFGDSSDMAKFLTVLNECVNYRKIQKVWILTSHWKFTLEGDIFEGVKTLHGALQFRNRPSSEFSHFLLSLEQLIKEGDLGVGFEFAQEYRPVYPSFFRINPSDFPECVGLVQLLLYFQWNWVGLVTSEDDSGEYFISTLMSIFKEKEICLVFSETWKSKKFIDLINKLMFNILWKAEVIILFGDSTDMANFLTALNFCVKHRKIQNVWILTSHWKFTLVGDIFEGVKTLHGALQFRDSTGDVSEFSHFLLSLDQLIKEGDAFLQN
ncbi:hypothetical protein E2320_022271, partial [Naja naja]